VITVTKEGMLAYLLSEWSVMKRISNGDDDDKTTDVQVMWEKIPEDLRYDWLQDLTEAERLDFYLDATPQIQAAMSYMNLLSPAALKQSQRMSQWFSDDDENDGDDNAYATTAITTHNDWVSRLWSNNTTRQQQWQQQQDFSKYQQTKGLSDQQILDYALLQSLIESNPNLAQQQMEENHYPSADTAESMFDEANKDWQQQLALLPQQHNKNNVVVNDCTTIREL
jgi:adenosyl cobinamide kinase/adenosyl cobinamide phosphate guanylyltransferase